MVAMPSQRAAIPLTPTFSHAWEREILVHALLMAIGLRVTQSEPLPKKAADARVLGRVDAVA
jgi:hypothetical protein